MSTPASPMAAADAPDSADSPAPEHDRASRRPVPLIPAATIAAIAGALLIAGAMTSQIGALTSVAVIQLLLVLSWVSATALPGRIGAVLIGAAAAAAADFAAMRWYEHGYESALAVLGLALAVMFAHQLSRGVVRKRVVESLSGIAVLLIALAAVTGLLLLRRHGGGDHLMAAIAAAAAAGLTTSNVVDSIVARPRFDPTIDRGLIGVIAGVLLGGVAGVLAMRGSGDLATNQSALAGAGTAAVSCLVSVGTSFSAVSGARSAGPALMRPAAAALISLCLAVPAGYVLMNGLSQ